MVAALTTEEFEELYKKGDDSTILTEIFGNDYPYFDFSTYKEKSGWNNKDFNPLYQLIELGEFLTDTTDMLDENSKKEIYNDIVVNFSPD